MAQQTGVPELGVWLDDSQQGAVEIYICQDRADRLCGRIVWLRDPLNAEGKPKFDRYNPNAALQGRPICGLPVLGNLAKSSDGGFDNGWIYDPKAGKSYSAAIALNGANALTVTGYLGLKFMGKTFTWTRAPDSIERCSVGAAPAPAKAPVAPAAPVQKPAAAAVPAAGAAAAAAASSGGGAQKQAAPAKAKPQTAATGSGGAQQAPASGSKTAGKPQEKTATAKTATSASPVLTAPPKPAKKPTTTDEAEALPWQKQ